MTTQLEHEFHQMLWINMIVILKYNCTLEAVFILMLLWSNEKWENEYSGGKHGREEGLPTKEPGAGSRFQLQQQNKVKKDFQNDFFISEIRFGTKLRRIIQHNSCSVAKSSLLQHERKSYRSAFCILKA
jgi:hypothetical protein